MAVVVEFAIGYNLRWLRHREPSALRVAQLQRETNGSRTCRELSSPTRWGERKGCGRGRREEMIPLSVCLSLSSPSAVVVCCQYERTASFLCVHSILVSVCVCVEQCRRLSKQHKETLKLQEVESQGGRIGSVCFEKLCQSLNQVMRRQ